MSPEQDDLQAEQEDVHADDEYEDYGPRSVFAAGWFRAVLVLIVLAIVAVVAVPYLLDWFGPTAPPATAPEPVTKGAEAPVTPAPSPESPSAQSVASAPSTPAPQSSATPAAPAPGASSTRAAAPAWVPTKRSSERPAGVSTRPRSEARGSYWVQVGSFKDVGNAERLARKLNGEGLSAQVARVTRRESAVATDAGSGVTFHLVRVGAFPDRQRAVAARDDLETRGYPGFLTRGAAK